MKEKPNQSPMLLYVKHFKYHLIDMRIVPKHVLSYGESGMRARDNALYYIFISNKRLHYGQIICTLWNGNRKRETNKKT